MNKPEIGQKIYIPTELYVGHGEDDIKGGIATIQHFKEDLKCPNEYNRIFVKVKEINGPCWNWYYLLEHQEEWKKEYGDQIAHEDPDYTDYGERWI